MESIYRLRCQIHHHPRLRESANEEAKNGANRNGDTAFRHTSVVASGWCSRSMSTTDSEDESIREPLFGAWVTSIFSNPASELPFYDDLMIHSTSERDATASARFMTKLFESPLFLCRYYSIPQIAQGLWYLACSATSNHMYCIHDNTVPRRDRIRLVTSFHDLFALLFAAKCANYFSSAGHGPEPASPLNTICFMWWDLLPLSSRIDASNDKQIRNVALETLQRTLRLASWPCQEAALHGFGHYKSWDLSLTSGAINAYLARNDIPPELRSYAAHVRDGIVQ